MKSNKILLTLFVILLVVVGIEVLFFFSMRPVSQKTETKELKPKDTLQLFNQAYFPSPYPRQAIKEDALVNLRVLKKGVLKSFMIQYTYEGIITQAGRLKNNNMSLLELSITGDQGDKNKFTYPETIVVIRKNGVPVLSGGVSNLKAEEKIKVEVSADLLLDKIISVSIDILNTPTNGK